MSRKPKTCAFTVEGFVMARERHVNNLLLLNKVDEKQLADHTELVAAVIVEAESMSIKKGCRQKSCYDRGYLGFDRGNIPVLCVCTKLKLESVFKRVWQEKKDREVKFTPAPAPQAPTPETPNAPAC